MQSRTIQWSLIAILVAATLAIPIFYFLPDQQESVDNPWRHISEHPHHTDHAALMPGPYEDGPGV